jgi:DNA-binding transcriptional LysR family regulator
MLEILTMELRHLRYFLAVAEELHFGRAAERLGIAQPPLSQQIKRLESELGVKLFARTKRYVALTAAGSALREMAIRVIAQAEDAIQAAKRAHRGDTGCLNIGFVGSAAYTPLAAAIRTYMQRYPGRRANPEANRGASWRAH